MRGSCRFTGSPFAAGSFTCVCEEERTGKFCQFANPFSPSSQLLAILLALAAAAFCQLLLYGFVQRNVDWLIQLSERYGLCGGSDSAGLRLANEDLHQRLLEREEEMAVLERAWLIQWSELVVEKEVARGAFGVVLKASWNDMPVAVKQLKGEQLQMNSEAAEEFDREMKFMRSIRHPNIVLFYGAGVTADHTPFLVTEFMERGSLCVVLSQEEDEINNLQRLQFAHDTALGMQHLHSLGAIHRDLKSGNLLVTRNFRIKVADFGTARLASMSSSRQRDEGRVSLSLHASGNAALTTMVGTPLWMAPEVVFKQPYTQKADVYSYGIVLFEILTRQTPWNDLPTKWLVSHLEKALREGRRPTVGSEHRRPEHAAFIELMELCWQQEADERPSFNETLAHDAFKVVHADMF
jgi:serine/threonine-protein kinase CTR1